ncbi:hypothetical protein HNY73_002169 [Argiope bruennichi]|uniref:Uncharacterized protein n=1 Tax=Argiope bruennichi TaxID=94029 RepID=A0A8T0FU21_ARGBR|nr:hypothetical protein HNY73_002169 [Argiope bruennichi]
MMPLRDFLLVRDASSSTQRAPRQNSTLVSTYTVKLLAISGITFLLVAVVYLIFGITGTGMYLFFSIFLVLETVAIILSLKPVLLNKLHSSSTIPDRGQPSSHSSIPSSAESKTPTRSMSEPTLLH